MKPWKIVALAILAIPIVSLATCFIPYDWREALVIEVETPDGVKTGRSVVLVSHTIEAIVPGSPGGAVHTSLRGEATTVEVAPGKYLFALLQGRENLAVKAFPEIVAGKDFKQFAKAFANLREKRDLPTALIPMLVTFRDINDPKTVERVDPNNLAEAFGQGVRLARASIEITNDPVTTGIEKYAPSYRNRDDWDAWRFNFPYGDPRRAVGPQHFRQGF